LCPQCLLKQGLEAGDSRGGDSTAGFEAGFAAPQPTELARHFPQLEILEFIGKGGMGAVYKARQKQLDRIIALKILPPEVGRDPTFAERFSREARALAKLNHPNIVSIYDSGEKDGLFYFAMEYVDGVNLREAIKAEQVSPEKALAIVPQICDALQYAHEEGVVHRDIKPENVLLDRKGRVKIADFGLSKLLGHEGPEPILTQTHQVMGTLRYMAPEQMQGTKSVDHRADIYSLGVVFYELLTGEVPMGRFEPPSQRVQVDVRLDEVVLRSLEREPTKRYQHASEVKTDVEMISRDVRPFAPVAAALSTPATTPVVPDGVVFQRLTVFNVLFWLVWSALLATLQWGYLNEERWYFQKELPYTYLSGAWNIVSLMFAFFLSYWWYLLAKSPQTPRSFQDALRVMQTPDRRHLRLWIPLGALLVVWIAATVLTMSFYDDDVQSTTPTALFS
jgi:serine/threonine protein kinase